MASRDARKRLPPTVSLSTTTLCPRLSYGSKGPRASSSAYCRSSAVTAERRHRGGRPPSSGGGSLLPLFSSSKKGWRVQAHPRFKTCKQVPQAFTFPDVAHYGCCSSHRTRHMVCDDRLKGGLFPCAHCRGAQAVSPFQFSTQGLPIQSSSIWTLSSPPGVHKVRPGCTGTSPSGRHVSPAVLGRLAAMCSNPGTSDGGHQPPFASCHRAWLQGELGEELPNSCPISEFHRHALRLQDHAGHSHQSQTVGDSACPGKSSSRTQDLIHSASKTGGTAYSSNHSRSVWPTVPTAVSTVADRAAPVIGSQPVYLGTDDKELQLAPPAMETGRLPTVWSPNGPTPRSQGGNHNGCLSHRLGRGVATSGGKRSMGSSHETLPYQCSRTTSCFPDSQAFRECSEGKTCDGEDRQHLCGVSHKSPGRHKVPSLSSSDTGTPDLGRNTFPLPPCNTHSRSPQCGARCTVPEETEGRRLALAQGGCAENLEHLWHSDSRLVRVQGDNTLPSVVCRDGRTGVTGQGCSDSRVAGCATVCVPTYSTDLGCAQSSTGNGPQGALGSAQMAEHALVSLTTDSNRGASPAIANEEGSSVPNGGAALAPLSRQAETLGLATGGNQSVMDCSEGVRHTVLNARAQSTRTMYENRWKLFTTWCTTHSLNPLECPVVTILDFLQHLLDNGRSPATLRVYVAALAAYRAPTEGVSLGAHKLVVAFMKGAQRLHPRPRTDCASWDLHTVLNGLCSPPFEPLEQAEIKWLSIKTAFLLAITSTKRVSELHALSVSAQCMRWGPEDSQVTLWPNPAFLPKVLSPQFANQPIVLAAFRPDDEPRSELCPVRALRQYVSQTAQWRKTDQLFIRFGECGKGAPLSKQRLAHWVSEAITSAYRFADKTAPASARCHSTRAVATSWAALRGISLVDICSAATWSSPCTFSRFYRVNVVPLPPVSSALLPSDV